MTGAQGVGGLGTRQDGRFGIPPLKTPFGGNFLDSDMNSVAGIFLFGPLNVT